VYGPIVSLKVGRSTVVILNDPRAVHTLQHVRGPGLANRPVDDQISLTTNGEHMALMQNTPAHKLARKIATQVLSPKNLDGRLARILEAE
jgi:cytochrome P450